ncbi:hypothetical protein AVEN_186987-1 [Araneus ventricosus]|uniref:DUF7041 domain-containing protein n=1 Tax=Araneus ventricosus TaxID=182803 RepID=A0A4Y2H1W9_ARAVE|nr:hypothetical protein AVEN_186987-1 [Araneus ventricosus]
MSEKEGKSGNADGDSESLNLSQDVAALDPQTLTFVSDLLYTPPKDNPYTALKNRLLSEFEVSQNKKVRALPEDLDLGDRKPSLLLRQMQELSEGLVDDAFLKNLWLNRLPVNIRTILSISSESLHKLAEMADSTNIIWEKLQP